MISIERAESTLSSMGKKSSILTPQQLKDLRAASHSSKEELERRYKGFLKDCPSGRLMREEFYEIYRQFFPHGDASSSADYVFKMFDPEHSGLINFKRVMSVVLQNYPQTDRILRSKTKALSTERKSEEVSQQNSRKPKSNQHVTASPSQSDMLPKSTCHNLSIHEFYHHVLRSLADSCRSFKCSQSLRCDVQQSLKRSLGELYMWAQGLDLQFLQNSINQDTGLPGTVVRELAAIEQSLGEIFPGRKRPQNKFADLVNHYRVTTSDKDDEFSSASSTTTDVDEASEPEDTMTSHRVHTRLSRRLALHLKSLMHLSQTLQNYCSKMIQEAAQAKDILPREVNIINQVVQPYVIQIKDKFRLINLELALKLGEANWSRFKRLQALQHRIEGEHSQEQELAATFHPVSEFHDSGLGASLPAKSRYQPSIASHTSFLSTQSAATRGVVKVPPTPGEVELGVPFTCSICGQKQSHIKNRIDWKLHVFADLQPYICTSTTCEKAKTTFPTRSGWSDHEFKYHRSRTIFRCFVCSTDIEAEQSLTDHLRETHSYHVNDSKPQSRKILQASKTTIVSPSDLDCPMCLRPDFKDTREWSTHVGRHMEEIALIVLPRSVVSNDDDDENNNLETHDVSLAYEGKDFAAQLTKDDYLHDLTPRLSKFQARQQQQSHIPKIIGQWKPVPHMANRLLYSASDTERDERISIESRTKREPEKGMKQRKSSDERGDYFFRRPEIRNPFIEHFRDSEQWIVPRTGKMVPEGSTVAGPDLQTLEPQSSELDDSDPDVTSTSKEPAKSSDKPTKEFRCTYCYSDPFNSQLSLARHHAELHPHLISHRYHNRTSRPNPSLFASYFHPLTVAESPSPISYPAGLYYSQFPPFGDAGGLSIGTSDKYELFDRDVSVASPIIGTVPGPTKKEISDPSKTLGA